MKLENTPDDITLEPFLKWAGGKRWLTQARRDLFPKSYKRYIEPFLGGASVFFHLKPKKAILSDLNADLINCYNAIRIDWRLVWRYLTEHHRHHGTKYYYQVRDKKYQSDAARAAQFIYLNRTCWNGLYRVNLAGTFNVPIGTKNWAISDADDFDSVANLLSCAKLIHGDFEKVIDQAEQGDLVFADPPYTVKHNFNGFVKYNEKLFSWGDQERLAASLVRARNRGAMIVSTNAHHPSVIDLYKNEFELVGTSRASVIAGDPDARGRFEELIITSASKA